MKKFLMKILVFTAFAWFILIGIYCYLFLEINRNANFRLDNNIQTIIVGHSHSACAYNDSFMPNFKNLSQSGESYFYTFKKIEKIILNNSQIKTVFIEFANNQIDTSMDRWTFTDPFLSTRLSIYEPFLNTQENLVLMKQNPIGFLKCIPLISRKMTERVLLKRYNYIKILGGFEKNNLSRVKTHLSLTKKSEIKISRVKYSKTNIFYLKKIINLLKLKRINYFLIRTPTHPMSLFRRNEKLYKKLLNNCLKCKGRFIDFADYRLADHNYYDLDHLNSKGAALFSKMFFKFSSRIK